MFDPNLGRWMQEDPLGFDAGDVNLYRALENNPTNLVDPSGLEGEGAQVAVTPSKTGRLTASIGKFQFPPIPAGLDVHTNVDIRWRTYQGIGEGRTLLSAGQYIVWLKGRDIVDTLRTKTIDMNLSPLHGGQNFRPPEPGEPAPRPLPGYPDLKTEEDFRKYIDKCFNARGTSGLLQIRVRVKGFETSQTYPYNRPTPEPTGPTEFPGNMHHPSRPGQGPKPVRPNRLQRLSGMTQFFRELAPWSLDMPPFWESPAAYDKSIFVKVTWEWPADAPNPTVRTSITGP